MKKYSKKYRKILVALLAAFTMMAVAGCGGGSESGGNEATLPEGYEPGTEKILTVATADGTETEYSEADLVDMGMVEYQYSGRNKEQSNERQIRTYMGVALDTLFDAAGADEVTSFIVVCSDGYTREYDMATLSDLYFFENNDDGTEGQSVPPMLALLQAGEEMGNDKTYDPKDGNPLRLVFGQESYDSSETMDFNMQGWANYVERIEITG